MENSRGEEGTSWENLRLVGNEQFTRGMWEYFTLRRAEAKRTRDDAAWQQETPFMRKGHIAIRKSRWEEFKEECRVKVKSSEWAVGTIREAYEKVVKRRSRTLGYCSEILRKTRTS